MTQPLLHVGILTAQTVSFIFHGCYRTVFSETLPGEQYTVVWENGMIRLEGKEYRELIFEPADAAGFFTLPEVTIGVSFHWERKEEQSFRGALKLLATPDGIVVINVIPVEEYLTSVISSEMNASASKEFLKAHAVISRSWLLAQLEKNKTIQSEKSFYNSHQVSENEIVRWYDREDHQLFDVCADDHCQRYQGITRASLPVVQEVIAETQGEVLYYDGRICDARFSKCCGGVTEQFEYCWEPVSHPYLTARRDGTGNEFPDLTDEANAIQWIRSAPAAFCNTQDKRILGQVLNNYDQETVDFYRWQVSYDAKELSRLIRKKSGLDFGEIVDIQPVKRGLSGRLEKIQIVGSEYTCIIGKELEIRRILSESHLYSSAFVVEKKVSETDGSVTFVFTGAGWGHGVGLCQIGAAVMGDRGYSYKDILSHYFLHAVIKKSY